MLRTDEQQRFPLTAAHVPYYYKIHTKSEGTRNTKCSFATITGLLKDPTAQLTASWNTSDLAAISRSASSLLNTGAQPINTHLNPGFC